jgi:hypothetical protein
MINIGRKDAKKFVLQAIGRGVRIEPRRGMRKRLGAGDKNKYILLETLFIFATDKNSLRAIVETVNENRIRQEQEISLWRTDKRHFDLLIPVYKEMEDSPVFARFNIAAETLEKFKKYCGGLDKNLMLLKNRIGVQNLNLCLEKIQDGSLFQIRGENIYGDMSFLFQQIMELACIKQKIVDGVKELENEIIHFKHIKVFNLSEEETEFLKYKIKRVKNFRQIDKKELEKQIVLGKIDIDKATELRTAKPEEEFKKLKVKRIVNHYYLPLIYSEEEKVDYISHIIRHPSEVWFIKSLDNYVTTKRGGYEDPRWMFCKIDENLDKMGIPYFYRRDNSYKEFFPDFIFWFKENKSRYRIIFIDPKGTSHTDYENKVDDFERLFFEKNGKPKVFVYRDIKITFGLRLVGEDRNAVGEKYRTYWLNENDFEFFEAEQER